MNLNAEQQAALAERFRYFNPERCDAIFAMDQEPGGLFLVEGQGRFPGVAMVNGAIWFHRRDQRPRRLNQENRDVGPMKTKAPAGARRILCDSPGDQELLLVEGEGHGVALLSVGWTGVAIAGGVNIFQSRRGWATEELTRLVRGKRIRIAFDFDAAGQKAAKEVKTRLLECGATHVAILPPQDDWEAGADIEDWLASFSSADAAYIELNRRLTNLHWDDEATEAERAEAEGVMPEQFVRTHRKDTDTERSVVTAVYDEEAHLLRLAVLGPPSEDAPQAVYDSIRHDAEAAAGEQSGMAHGWQVMERWLHQDIRYVPDDREGMIENIRRRTIVLPAPPADSYGTSEQLWTDVKDFIGRWLALGQEDQYHLLTSYVFMSYRLFDAGFPFAPYLRFHGPPGSGKGRALSVMKSICCWSLDGQPTADNLHRVIEYFGEITLCIDEFHLDRGQTRETMERIIDTLNLGNDATKTKLRCTGNGTDIVVSTFSLYGPKIFAGYGSDEHEAIARRTVNIDMDNIDVPPSMDVFALPPRFYAEAYALRRRLMAWRAAKFQFGLPNPEGPRARRLLSEAGREVGQILWPLLEMVPAGLPAAEEAVLRAAVQRKIETQETRAVSEGSYLLEEGISARARHAFRDVFAPNVMLFSVTEMAQALDMSSVELGRQLKRMGLVHARKRRDGVGTPIATIAIDGSTAERRTFARYGVAHPFDIDIETEEEAGL